jgi:hypothetical protein
LKPQHSSPQTFRPSGHVVGLPLLQLTLQLPTLVHCTEQLPEQVTLQLPTLVQTTVLASSTVGAQSLTLSQMYAHPASHCATSAHCTWTMK